MLEDGPVPGRECGACDACCVVFQIDEPNIAKPAGVPCRHLTKPGCAIYEHRPQMCRAWLCGWRLIAGLPDTWRPDLSGILIYQKRSEHPAYVADGFVIALANGLAHINDTAVLGFIQNLVKNRIPIFLILKAGGPDMVFLNPALEPMVQAGDGTGFIAALSRLISSASRPNP